MADNCASSNKQVGSRQQAIQCDQCQGWQHRTCNSGISQSDYRQMVRGQKEIEFTCSRCSSNAIDSSIADVPFLESTRLDALSTELCSLEQQRDINECTVLDSPPTENSHFDPTNIPTSYQKVKGSTKRAMSKLIDNRGYSYTVKRKRDGRTDWQCCKRSKTLYCLASVREFNGVFVEGSQPHLHGPIVGATAVATVDAKIRETAQTDLFAPASTVVNRALAQVDMDQHLPIPQLQTLCRRANRVRETTCPKDPSDLSFEVDINFINNLSKGFLRADIRVGSERHLVLATDDQLQLLSRAKTWYMDGTFRVVKHPFTQLMSIHSFVKSSGGNFKQVPLLYVLMSRRKTKDYKAVLKELKKMLPSTACTSMVMDFEKAAWKAVRSIFPVMECRGCAFHWGQAVWQKVQSLGLQSSYTQRAETYKFIKKIMALPYLPADNIENLFAMLKSTVESPALETLVEYVEETWVSQDALWSPCDWSVYNKAVHTKNDLESWHRRLNHSAGKSSLPMYLLVQLLVEEANLSELHVRLLSDERLHRRQRKHGMQFQNRLFYPVGFSYGW